MSINILRNAEKSWKKILPYIIIYHRHFKKTSLIETSHSSRDRHFIKIQFGKPGEAVLPFVYSMTTSWAARHSLSQ